MPTPSRLHFTERPNQHTPHRDRFRTLIVRTAAGAAVFAYSGCRAGPKNCRERPRSRADLCKHVNLLDSLLDAIVRLDGDAVVEAGNVFTLELGVPTSAGLVGLEEDVLVTAAGCEFLSTRQRELVLI